MDGARRHAALVNPAQAVFGVLWGVWYGGLTRDVLACPTIALPRLSLSIAKLLYVIVSLIWLAFIVYLLYQALDRTTQVPAIFTMGSTITFREGWAQLGTWVRWLAVLFFGLWGFLGVTYWLFQANLDSLLVLFGALQLPVWLGFELWYVGRDADQS